MRRLVPTLVLLAAAGLVPLTSTEPARAVGATSPDFNGDGYADLAIGAQGENDGAGLVHVLYGSASGPSGAGSIAFDQDTPEVPGAARAGDNFGAILAFGNVDGDAYDDLAVGAFTDRVGSADEAGSVTIFRGSASGLNMHGRIFTDNFGPGDASREEWFGIALAFGDFDGDGDDDLAIGNPWDDYYTQFDPTGIGSVKILRSDGGNFSEDDVWVLRRKAIDSTIRSSRLMVAFGSALTTLRGSSPFDGVAVGVRFASTNTRFDFGGAAVFHGRATGFGFRAWIEGPFGAGGSAGTSLASGDLDNDGEDDLVIGAPYAKQRRGGVEVALLSATRTLKRNPWLFTQETGGWNVVNAAGDGFGYMIAIVDTGTDAYIYIGTPGDDVKGKRDSGSVHVLVSHPTGKPQAHGTRPIMSDDPQTYGQFGLQVTALDATNDGFADLVVSANGETVNGRLGAGAVWWLDSNDGIPVTTGGVRYTQNSPGVPGNAEIGDSFGSTLAFL